MDKVLNTLEQAISDVGFWRWWDEELPDVFQVEFGGTQIWNRPNNPESPPSNVLALRFVSPRLVAFIRKDLDSSNLSEKWHEKLKEDNITSVRDKKWSFWE